VVVFCLYGNEPFGSMKSKEFLDQLSNFKGLMRNSSPRSLVIVIYEDVRRSVTQINSNHQHDVT
jgi:hypothetical protein